MTALVYVRSHIVSGEDIQPKETSSPLFSLSQTPWKGDLDDMVKRGYIRVLTTYNPLFISYKDWEQRGAVVEISRALQDFLRTKLGEKARDLNVVVLVVPRDELLPRLKKGKGDIAIANLTVTRNRLMSIDFGKPTITNVSELVVTSPSMPEITSFTDLADVGVHIRQSSSYYEHMLRLNAKRSIAGQSIIPVNLVDESLEDYDLLEMLNANMIQATVVDSHTAKLWSVLFQDIKIHEQLSLNDNGEIAWAIRKNSPQLKKMINQFHDVSKEGTFLGNLLRKRYSNSHWVENNTSPQAQKRLESISAYIKNYAQSYGFDWLLIAAQGYQESRLDQNKRSPVGAVGVMQVMPETAKDANVNIPDIYNTENNIHAGIKYLKHLHDNYFNDPDISQLDRMLFSFAAYNAGPGNIARTRKRAAQMGLNPNKWFQNVEIAAAQTVSREPVTYVRNIFKYYVSYKHRQRSKTARDEAKADIETASP